MSAKKCINCGLVNFNEATECKRCGMLYLNIKSAPPPTIMPNVQMPYPQNPNPYMNNMNAPQMPPVMPQYNAPYPPPPFAVQSSSYQSEQVDVTDNRTPVWVYIFMSYLGLLLIFRIYALTLFNDAKIDPDMNKISHLSSIKFSSYLEIGFSVLFFLVLFLLIANFMGKLHSFMSVATAFLIVHIVYNLVDFIMRFLIIDEIKTQILKSSQQLDPKAVAAVQLGASGLIIPVVISVVFLILFLRDDRLETSFTY